MALSYTATCKNNMLDELTALIDAGAGAGTIKIYSGTPPANADAALSGNTLLAEPTFSDPSAGAASGGTWTASSITQDATPAAAGTATFFRLVDSNGNVVAQGSVTATSGGGDLELSTTSITTGSPVSITSWTIAEGN